MGCIQEREGKYSREFVYRNSSIKLIDGVIEEIDSQAIVNLSLNPMTSKLREQVYKYIYNHLEDFNFIEQERDIIQLEQLSNKVFVNTETLLNFQIDFSCGVNDKYQISECDLMTTFEQILQFADNTSYLYQICFTDYIMYEIHDIDYNSYADCLVKSVFKFLTQNKNRHICSVKFLCMKAINLNTIFQKMMKYENYDF
ncbi:unnamed protein product [Paramecium sonneborni]|uniref:Uncharacterized protein n=1 Tax=Paramecium sonneborni TaxID=65129 RepID=A0A8S1QW94_9CILI|nr:unnamed protein product [Paramecium sonneborni]